MRVTQYLIVVPILAQVAVTLTVWCTHWLAEIRGLKTAALENANKKQFELPLLFYSAVAFAYSFRLVDEWQLLMALGFVLSFAIATSLEVFSGNHAVAAVILAIAALAVTGMWIRIAAHFATAGF